ncbi:bile acid:sodium symporter family protein [bacterium]|nr:bile acid:sodium symporter family protein [bacterium]
MLNLALAVIMFGIALSLKRSDFRAVVSYPKAALAGLFSQYLLLPAITVLLIIWLQPIPSLALGMVLIAACPGGNVSNFFTYLAKGNVALSVGLSMVSTLAAFVVTPLQLKLWSSLLPQTQALYASVHIDFWQLVKIVMTIMVLPLIAGMFVSKQWPAVAQKIKKPIKVASFVLLLIIIAAGLAANTDVFSKYYQHVVYLVFLHNGLALFLGFLLGLATGIGRAATKTISIETGIQNTGLGLVLVFNFFDGNGAMAIIAAWYGIWHIISGFLVSLLFKQFYKSE